MFSVFRNRGHKYSAPSYSMFLIKWAPIFENVSKLFQKTSPFYRIPILSRKTNKPNQKFTFWVQRFPFSFPPKFAHSFSSKQAHRLQTVFISSHFKPVVTSVFVKGKTQNMGFVKPKIGDIPRSNVVLLCFSALLRQNLSFPFHVIHRRGCFFQEGEVGLHAFLKNCIQGSEHFRN